MFLDSMKFTTTKTPLPASTTARNQIKIFIVLILCLSISHTTYAETW